MTATLQAPVHARAQAPRTVAAGMLELEVISSGDPVRFARIVSSVVNNTPLALAEVLVDGQPAYPVPSIAGTGGRGCTLRLRLRNHRARIDQLLVEQIVTIVSSTCQVVEVRRAP